MSQIKADRRTRCLAALSCLLLMFAVASCSDDDPTSPRSDTIAPTVSATNPLSNAIGVAVITATFSESMNASTITTATMKLTGPGAVPVDGTVTYTTSPAMAHFTPAAALTGGTVYLAMITTGAKDAAGNAMAASHSWSFTTSVASNVQAVLVLGEAGDFAVLAGSTVTSTGTTALTGDLGVSPGAAVTGFPPGTMTGTLYAGNATSAAAMADLTTAYNDAAGRTQSPVTVSGNLGGLTLPPGLYRSTSGLAISSGDLTLDARGDPDAVFVFQIASTFTTSEGRSVILSGGARSANVFWQVGSSATLGTTSVVKGTILANQSITLNNNASLNGRALARIGAVTLAANAIVMPTP